MTCFVFGLASVSSHSEQGPRDNLPLMSPIVVLI